MYQLISSSYEHKLAAVYHRIEKRGLLLDQAKLENARILANAEITKYCQDLSVLWGFPCYVGTENAPGLPSQLNLNSPEKVLERLKDLGYKVPKIRKKDEETNEYEMEESAGELALRKLLSDPTLWPSSDAGQAIKMLLDNREVLTFKNRYLKARLNRYQYLCTYGVAATVTGRRGSKKNPFGFGGNAQNFPARGRLSDIWKECIIARPGKIFLFVDQMQAEDWPVQSLAENHSALADMRAGINRHYKFAAAIFNRTIEDLKKCRSSSNDLERQQADMEYNLGKRGRHANNYGMQPARLSEILAGEGYSVPKSTTQMILETINRIDPNVKAIFHNYIQEQLRSTRILRTPLGRERQFFGLRANDKNYNIFNEAYSYIPQSTVGDNTGLAILYLDGCNDYVLQESHDSICQELPDNWNDLRRCLEDTREAFNRTIKFHNGIEVSIPIEGKLGYSWKNTVTINDKPGIFDVEHLEVAYKKLKEMYG